MLQLVTNLASQCVNLGNAVNLVAEVLNTDDGIGRRYREYLNDIAAHAEGTALKVNLAACVLHINQTAQDSITFLLHART